MNRLSGIKLVHNMCTDFAFGAIFAVSFEGLRASFCIQKLYTLFEPIFVKLMDIECQLSIVWDCFSA